MNGAARRRETINGELWLSCGSCGKLLPCTMFYYSKNRKRFSSECIDCNALRDFVRRHKDELDCGFTVEEVKARIAEKKRMAQERKSRKDMYVSTNRTERNHSANICFQCKNACGGCDWTRVDNSKPGRPIMFKPISGWNAELVACGRDLTYSIKSCPEFIPDEKRDVQI